MDYPLPKDTVKQHGNGENEQNMPVFKDSVWRSREIASKNQERRAGTWSMQGYLHQWRADHFTQMMEGHSSWERLPKRWYLNCSLKDEQYFQGQIMRDRWQKAAPWVPSTNTKSNCYLHVHQSHICLLPRAPFPGLPAFIPLFPSLPSLENFYHRPPFSSNYFLLTFTFLLISKVNVNNLNQII